MIAPLAIAAVLLSGCALGADGIYKLAGPDGSGHHTGGGYATGDADRWREIEVDPRTGLSCRDVERPFVRTPSIHRRAKHPNGYKALMQVFTVAEAVSFGTAIAVAEHRCREPEGCAVSRTKMYLAIAPFLLDVLYGTYRSFTIHNEIVESSDISWHHARSIPAITQHDSCPPGTELVLHGGGEQLVVHVGDAGVTVTAELELIARFLATYPSFAVAGPNVRLDAARAAELVAHVFPPAPTVATTARATTTTTTPPPVVPPPGSATIEVDTPLGGGCVSIGSDECARRARRR